MIAEHTSVETRPLWKTLYDPRGRCSRKEFALTFVGFYPALGALYYLLRWIRDTAGIDTGLASALSLIALFGLLYVAVVRRLHDRGHTGWAFLLLAIPGINMALLAYLLLAPSRLGSKHEGQ